MWIQFYIEKKSASMLPEGNGSCFYIEKKMAQNAAGGKRIH